jgi:hypothetical protein
MARKSRTNIIPQVNPQLEGFDIQINEFGEIVSNFEIKKLNTFLDGTVEDKKFRGIDVIKRDDDTLEIKPADIIPSSKSTGKPNDE